MSDGLPMSGGGDLPAIRPSFAASVDCIEPPRGFPRVDSHVAARDARSAFVAAAAARLSSFGEGVTAAAIHYHRTSIPRDRMSPYPDVNATKFEKLQDDLTHLTLENYAEWFCREREVAKRKIPNVEITRWQGGPLSVPLLQATPKQSEAHALEAFQQILNYNTAPGLPGARALMQRVHGDAGLVDEVAAQLLKQSEGNPQPAPIWELLFFYLALFTPSQPNWIWIKAHCYRHSNDADPAVAHAAQLAFIRFATRVAGRLDDKQVEPTVDVIAGLFKHLTEGPQCYGVSIYEQMLAQSKRAPNCPIPLFLPRVVQALMNKGGLQREGIFRLPGNIRRVKEMAVELNRGDDPLPQADLNDLASLMKAWFGDLPISLVPIERVDELMDAAGRKAYLEFFEQLPPLHRAVFKYLAGFLKEFAAHAEVTRMPLKNLGICFSPNLIPSDSATAADAGKFADTGVEFIEALVNGVDTTGIWPLPPGVLP